ncbi:MAG: multicopper oxidase family protein [Thermomicrobiales bacterium]
MSTSESPIVTEIPNRPPGKNRAVFHRVMAGAVAFAGLALIAAALLMSRPAEGQTAFPEPQQLVSENGVLKATLTVSRQQVDIGGTPIVATVYNGSFVGPTFHVKPGDHVEISLVNTLGEMTNLHFHGLHVSPSGDADNIFLEVLPGQTQQYVLDIPANHPTGTYWYHAHMHGLAEEQIFGGLAGLFVVDGLTDLLPADLHDVKQQAFVLKDYQAKDGAILTENIDSNAPTTRTVNGAVEPTASIDSGETQLWSIVNASADIYYDVQLTGHQFHVVAEDGNPVWQVKSADSLVMPPGKRFDVLVQGAAPGAYELKTLAYDQQGDQYPEAPLATVTVNASSLTPATLPEKMIEPIDLATADIANSRTLVFDKDQAAGTFTIDGKIFDPNRVDQTVKLGSIEEWTIRNDNNQQHPFHIHVDSFQVMSINGEPYNAVNRQDVVNLPANGEVVVRIPFDEFTGKFVYHCHILNHEDRGMMGIVEVVP